MRDAHEPREPITLTRLPAVRDCTLFDLLASWPERSDSWILHYVMKDPGGWPISASARLWRNAGGRGKLKVRLVRPGRVDETTALSDPLEVSAFLGLEGDMAATKPWQRCQE